MGSFLADDVRKQYRNAFETLRRIVTACPEDRWKVHHGDDYYIPCRLAYHLASCLKYHLLGGFCDKDYYSSLPYGRWSEIKAENLPGKAELREFLEDVLSAAELALSGLTDENLAEALEPERAWAGESRLALHLYMMRELSAHMGELNKMLMEDGAEDIVWVR